LGFWTTGNKKHDFMRFFGVDKILISCDLWSKWEEKRVCRKTSVSGMQKENKSGLALEGRERNPGVVAHVLESFQKLSK
jgi:hypothetical protein